MLLKQCPQLTVDELSFFNGYREATGPMWTSFQKTLNDLGYTSQELSIIVGSANDTFLKFKQWIQQSMA
jgi:heme oxygenase